MILVPLLNPTFATVLAEKSCELRVRGTRICRRSSRSMPPGAAVSGQVGDLLHVLERVRPHDRFDVVGIALADRVDDLAMLEPEDLELPGLRVVLTVVGPQHDA